MRARFVAARVGAAAMHVAAAGTTPRIRSRRDTANIGTSSAGDPGKAILGRSARIAQAMRRRTVAGVLAAVLALGAAFAVGFHTPPGSTGTTCACPTIPSRDLLLAFSGLPG